ncbi:TauD/TfdA family dioxygenase [Nocardioides flavescens]|uniref:TauD/TfdA family dioxygenase n=1 Tax=Nocardioides flavescens TaxID=2691959 RepID=A0A6L7EPP9_9ACTN|nr:TauD/TfdA family dioxygenase [Nocardioides flavescens]
MQERVLEPVGVEVTGVDLGTLGADDVTHLRGLLAEHGVVVLPGQFVDDDTFLAFLRGFGPMTFTEGETPLEGHPDLNVISNVGRERPPRSQFHVDTSYVAEPPAYTALRAVRIPAQGGQTVFTNQYAAYESLPAELKERLEGRTVRHVATGVEVDDDAETSAEHPVFRPHPLTGRTALYLSTPQRCAAVSGMDDDEARATIEELLAHSTRDDNCLRHTWAPGDVVMWDNGCVLHKADHEGVVGDRVMHRGMVAGYAG